MEVAYKQAAWLVFQRRYVASFPEEKDRELRIIQDKVHDLWRDAQVCCTAILLTLQANGIATIHRSEGTQEQMEAYQDMAEALHATDHPGQVVMDGVASYKACQQGYGKNAYPA